VTVAHVSQTNIESAENSSVSPSQKQAAIAKSTLSSNPLPEEIIADHESAPLQALLVAIDALESLSRHGEVNDVNPTQNPVSDAVQDAGVTGP
jgi:hypothetical protein